MIGLNELMMAAGTATSAPISTVDMVDPFEDGSGIALYKLDGDATDESGAYNGTAYNLTYGTGKFGQCGVFNGTSSRIYKVNAIPALGGTTFSISVWVKTVSSGAIYGSDDSSADKAHFMSINEDGYVNYYVAVALTDLATNKSTIAVNDGQWHHIVWIFSYSGFYYLYIDGIINKQYSGAAFGSDSHPDQDHFSIGYLSIWQDEAFFNGSIDQVRIFNRALTAEEVGVLYAEQIGGCAPTVPAEGLVAHYKLDGDATDEIGMYDGTAYNLTYGTGKFGQCGVFNGVSGTGINTSILSVASARTVSAWIKIDAIPSSLKIALGGGTLAIQGDSGGFFAAIQDSNSVWYSGPRMTTVGSFVFVCIAYDAAGVYFRTDSISSSSSWGGSQYVPPSYNDTITFGARTEHRDDYSFAGSIDQVRIYDRALTTEEITALYQEGV